ncbi:MAG: hypothetical protein AAB243_02790, partial [Planctomycetota bacterium]
MRVLSQARLKPCLQTYGKMVGADLSAPNSTYRNIKRTGVERRASSLYIKSNYIKLLRSFSEELKT